MHRLGIALALVTLTTPALAGRRTPGVTEDELERPSEIEPSVADGTMMPWSIAARHARQGILISSYGGFDAAKRAPIMAGVLDATLMDRVTLRAVATNTGMSDQLKPNVGLVFDLMRESDYGFDFALAGDYDVEGWSRVPAVGTRALLGTTLGMTRLQANAGFNLGLDRGAHYGDLRLSGLHPVAQALYAGIDTRARLDLASGMADGPSGALAWDVQAGPVISLAVGRFAVSATGGVSAWKGRMSEQSKVGAMGALGVGAAF